MRSFNVVGAPDPGEQEGPGRARASSTRRLHVEDEPADDLDEDHHRDRHVDEEHPPPWARGIGRGSATRERPEARTNETGRGPRADDPVEAPGGAPPAIWPRSRPAVRAFQNRQKCCQKILHGCVVPCWRWDEPAQRGSTPLREPGSPQRWRSQRGGPCPKASGTAGSVSLPAPPAPRLDVLRRACRSESRGDPVRLGIGVDAAAQPLIPLAPLLPRGRKRTRASTFPRPLCAPRR